LKREQSESFRRDVSRRIAKKSKQMVKEWNLIRDRYFGSRDDVPDDVVTVQGLEILDFVSGYLETGEANDLLHRHREMMKENASPGSKSSEIEVSLRIWENIIYETLSPEFEDKESRDDLLDLIRKTIDELADGLSRETERFYSDHLERKVEERTAELEDIASYLRSLFQIANDGIAYLDGHGKIIDVNERGVELFGGSKDQVMGKRFIELDLISDKDVDALVGAFEDALAGNRASLELQIVNTKGQKVDLECSMSVMVRDEMESGILVVARDVTRRKEVEKAIHESEEKFRSLAEKSPNMIFINNKGRIVYANEKCEEMTGYSRKELYSPDFDFLTLIAPESRDLIMTSYKSHVKKQEVLPYEYTLVTRDGSRIEAILATKLIDYEGETAILGVVTDISERKQAELALKESEEKYYSLFNEARDGIVLIEAKSGQIVDCNPEFERICGRKLGGLRHMKIWETRPQDKVEAAERKYVEVRENGKGWSDKLDMQTPDGELVPVEFVGKVVEIGGRKYIQSLVRDISFRKKAEEQLRYQASLLENVSDAVISTDMDFSIKSWNRAAEHIYGWKEEDAIGKNVDDVTRTEYPDGNGEDIIKRIIEAGFWTGEVLQQRKDGKAINIQASMTIVKDANGDPVGAVSVNRDITQRLETQEALRRSEKEFKDFVENALVGVVKTNLKGEVLYANQAAAEMFGFESPEVGMMEGVLSRYKDPLKREAFLKELMTKGKVQQYEHQLLTRTGETKDIIMSALFDGETLSGVLIDITPLRRAERERMESEEKYRSLVERAGAGIATSDLEGRFSYVNEELCRMIGYSEEELIGKPFIDFIHHDDQEGILELFLSAFENPQKEQELEFRVIHKEGHTVDLYSRPTIFWLEDEIAGFNAIITDVTARKKAEEALIESEERMKSTLSSMDDLIYVLDEDGVFIDYHEPIDESRQYAPPESFIGKGYGEVFPPEVSKMLEHAIREVSTTGLVQQLDHSLDVGGETRWFSSKVSQRLNRLGSFAGVTVVSRDMTERKMAEDAVRESEERYRLLAESSDDIIASLSQEGLVRYVSPASETLLGYAHEEMIGKNAFSIIHPDDVDKAHETFQLAQKRKIPARLEYRMKRKDGGHLWFETIGRPIEANRTDQQGEILCISRDITERRMADEELRSSEERLKMLFEHAPDAYVLLGDNGEIIDGNRAMERLLGFSREESVGRSLFDLGVLPPNETSRAMADVARTTKGEVVGPDEFVLIRKGGKRLITETRLFPVNIGGREMILATARDITDSRRAEEAKDRLLSNISHELRTPLTSIEGYAKFMLSGKIGELSEKHSKCLTIIDEESNRLKDLIDNFLDLIAIDAEGLKMDVRMVNVSQIIDQLMSSLGVEIEKKEISVSRETPTDLGLVRGDEERLHQLFSNLLTNAIKFTPKGGDIQIRSKGDGSSVVIEVVDSGVGIPPEDLPHIFERFYQGDSSPTRKFGGMGLGLAICNEIVEAHGGRIEAESKVGSGSVFRVTLPMTKEAGNGKQEDIGG
jgi:PAS domain S-box-containing protein